MIKHVKVLSLILVVILCACMTGCPDSGGESWSVFIYMCGTGLESDSGFATQNLYELLDVAKTDNIHFIIQTGGTSDWQNDYVSPEHLQRWALEDHSLVLIDEQPLASMGDAQTLGSFLSWGVQNYPADKYMAVFWNHGGGSASGIEYDELFGNDSLSLSEINAGLSAPNVTFELLGFDTCLMASLENAAAVAPYAHYMVASEEIEPGGGWDYTEWPQYLIDNPDKSGLEVGAAICDSYYAKCKESGEEAMATLSVIDLSMASDLVGKFDAVAGELTGVTEDISALQTLIQGSWRAENYGGNNDYEGYTNMVDLGDLVINTKDVLPGTSDALLDALNSAVKYNVKGDSRSEASGLSVYFPLKSNSNEFTEYAKTAAVSASYLRFIEAISNWQVPQDAAAQAPAVEAPVQEANYNVQLQSYISNDGYFTLNITSGLEAVYSVQFSIYYMDYNYNEYLLLGVDNDIAGDWNQGVFVDNFRGVWFTINGCYCAPTLIAETDTYNLYTIPILLNGERTNLRAANVWDAGGNGHFEVYGAWNGIDSSTGMGDRDIIQLKDGDVITLLFDAVNWNTGEITTYGAGSFTVNGGINMQESALFDGDYLYQYTVIDVFGRTTYSDKVIMRCSNGEIYLSEAE